MKEKNMRLNKNKHDVRSNKYKKFVVGYTMIHRWVRGMKGRPSYCEECRKQNNDDGRSLIEWATKSGKYIRDLSDWVALCRSCHMKFDGINRSAIQTKLWANPEYRKHMSEAHKGKRGIYEKNNKRR